MTNKTRDPRPETERAAIARPSRAEIETLCILDVVGRGDGTLGDLAERLGLARELAPAVEEAIQPLVALGHIDAGGPDVSLTKTGRDWLQCRLSELGLPASIIDRVTSEAAS